MRGATATMIGMNEHELIKAAITGFNGILLLALTWLVGQRLAYQWNVRQKRRELQLTALQQFYLAYGDFFAVWKLWNRLDRNVPTFDDRRWELWNRAATAESTVEGTLVKLSLEINLEEVDVSNLGRFRQAFQQLRESIRDNVLLPWPFGDCPEYKTFKALSIVVAALLNGEWSSSPISRKRAQEQLETITSNRWEDDWILPEFKKTLEERQL
jgi:hypothetical protein